MGGILEDMRTVSIDWQDNPAEDNVSKYRLEIQDAGSGAWSVGYEGAVSAATLTGFPDAPTPIRLSAYNGLWSEASAAFVVPASAPQVPAGISIIWTSPEE